MPRIRMLVNMGGTWPDVGGDIEVSKYQHDALTMQGKAESLEIPEEVDDSGGAETVADD